MVTIIFNIAYIISTHLFSFYFFPISYHCGTRLRSEHSMWQCSATPELAYTAHEMMCALQRTECHKDHAQVLATASLSRVPQYKLTELHIFLTKDPHSSYTGKFMLYWWFKKPACAEHVPSSQLTVTLSASRGLPAQKTVVRQEWCLVTVGLAWER